jgi:hypothetical protein
MSSVGEVLSAATAIPLRSLRLKAFVCEQTSSVGSR